MRWIHFKDLSIKGKILWITLATTALSLLLACLFILLNEWLIYPKLMEQNLQNLARIVGDNCKAALSFNDDKTAQEVLDTLKSDPHIQSAVLYDETGRIVALYPLGAPPSQASLQTNLREGVWINSERAWLYHYILSPQGRLGTLYLESDLEELRDRMERTALTTLVVLVLSFVISFFVAGLLQRRVTRPLQQVVDKMSDIARGEGDLSKRLEVDGHDEIGQVAESFNTFVNKLQTVDEMKQNLISVVSHQLKTPVAEINGYIENLIEGLAGPLTPRQKTYLEDMKEIGIENYRMICDLLSVSKIERGIISVNPMPVTAKRLVELSIRDYQSTIERKGLRLILQGMEGEVLVMADQDKTVETLRNLINNAVKFTDRGSITVSVLDLKDRAVLEVRDTGLGMDAETLERLFTKQRVLGKEAGRSGAGLGLFIAKRFMKLQNGDVEAVSTPGEGSCFRVTIPKAARPEGD